MNHLVNEADILEEIILNSKQQKVPTNFPQSEEIDWNLKLISDDTVLNKRESKITFNQENNIRYDDLLEILSFNDKFSKQFMTSSQLKIDQLVIPERVEGITENRCFYSFDSINKTLNKEFDLPTTLQKKELVIQEEFAQAGVIIIFVASIDEAYKKSGALGYKKLVQSIGSIGHYTWLQAIAYGYEGSVFAGFLQKSLRRFTDLDGYHKAQLFAVALG
ncbi:nitroreductase family protein [Lysinibacillus sp. NPDC056232]|uniref:nitroreductase family protein n=1 Tax=unclassified Lysinibacillus TaxID=2636778 RepID=UPI0035E0E52E